MTAIWNLDTFLAFFEEDAKGGRRKHKDFFVKQNPDDLEELQFASYYAKDLRAFCFGFDPDAPLADSMNFTRRTLFKKLLEKYQIPFFIEEKIL